MKKQFFLLVFTLWCCVSHANLSAQANIGRYTPPNSWTSYVIGNHTCEISIPSTMEIQDTNAPYARNMTQAMLDAYTVVFQQRGLNQETSSAYSRYARILIKCISGNPGDYPLRTESEPIDQEFRNSIEASIYRDVNSVGKLLKKPTIRWISIGGIKAIEAQYQRTGYENTTSTVHRYMLFDNNRMDNIIISVRDRDKGYFQPDLYNVIRTFKWK